MRSNEFVEKVLLATTENDLIIDIGNIHDKMYVEFEVVAENATNDIGRNVIPRMAKMRIIVYYTFKKSQLCAGACTSAG